MKVDDLDIPAESKKVIKEDGIEELYPPQVEGVDDVLSGNNCVFALPTASGKSLLSYLAIIKKVVEEGGKALYIVPLRALASEKVDDLKKFEQIGLKVGISMGNYDSPDPNLKDYDVIVATSEKADSLLRHNVDWLNQLNVVVADEVHLINDRERGATLEVTLSKLKQVNPEAQIIALSATIQNSDALADWLDASHHKSDWRPVELKKGVYFGGRIRYVDADEDRVENSDPVRSICIPTIEGGDQCLVFVRSRRSTESVSQQMSRFVKEHLTDEEKEELNTVAEDLEDRSTTSIGKKLASMVRSGTAFHNAGLNNYQRKAVENAFRNRLIKLITATPTLAAGINMPARRVVVRDYRRYDSMLGYNAPIPVIEIQQMLGRAGRPGYDDLGEAIIVAKRESHTQQLFDEYLLGESEVIVSRLATEPALRAHLLSLVATSHCDCEDDIFEFMEETFYAQNSDIWTIEDRVRKTLDLLEKEGLIEQDEAIRPTNFGRRVSDLYIDPLSAVKIKEAVDKGKMGLPISYLHTICLTPDMYNLFASKSEMSKYERKIEGVRADLFQDLPHDKGEMEDFLSAFKTAMMLKDWMDEVPEDEIAQTYSIGPGDIRNKVETAEWLMHSAAEIARLYNKQKAKLLKKLTTRVKYGIKEELFPLMDMEQIGRVRARRLYVNGYRTPEEVKKASKKELEQLSGIGDKIASTVTKKDEDEREEEDSDQSSLKDF